LFITIASLLHSIIIIYPRPQLPISLAFN
jgi:hypothetical protein